MLQSNATTLDGLPMNVSETAYSVIAFATAKLTLTGVRHKIYETNNTALRI